MTPAIAHDHKYFFFSLVTAYRLHATTACFPMPDNRSAVREDKAQLQLLSREPT